MSWIRELLRIFIGTVERPSPSDIIPTESITVVASNFIIDTAKSNIPLRLPPIPIKAEVLDTNSLDPNIDVEGNPLIISGASPPDHKILVDWIAEQWQTNEMTGGNVIIYQVPNQPRSMIIHRLARVGFDSEGRYFKFKGDNNASQDPYKVRDEHIKHLVIGNIW